MASMSVSLSDQMRVFIKSRIESGDYYNESEYIRDLVRKDCKTLSDEQQFLSLLRQSDQGGMSDDNVLDIMKKVKEKLINNGKL